MSREQLTCKACGDAIPEESVFCLHCGKRIGPAEAGRGDKLRARASEFLQRSLSTARERFGSAMDGAQAKAAEIRAAKEAGKAKRTAAEAEKAAAEAEPPVHLPVFILPTGPAPQDYYCHFDFSELIARYKEGAAGQPVLEVWAGRPDLDRAALGRRLKKEFSLQLSVQRHNLLGRFKEEEKESQSLAKRRAAADLHVSGTAAGVMTAVTAAFLLANPVFDFLLLTSAAIGVGTGTFSGVQRMQLSSRIREIQRRITSGRTEVTENLEREEAAFIAAVRALEIGIHPILRRLAHGIAEVECLTIPDEAGAPDAPIIDEWLRIPDYIAALPELYHPLWEAVAGRSIGEAASK